MEEELLAEQADTEGWYDKLKNARLTGRAMDSAQHNDAKEKAAAYPTSPEPASVTLGNSGEISRGTFTDRPESEYPSCAFGKWTRSPCTA